MSNALALVMVRIKDSNLAADQKRQAVKNLIRSHPDETAILAAVFEILATRPHAAEILSGAHVRIFDMGARYDAWKQLPSARPRLSSHRSDGPQFHVDGPLVHTVLFGRIGNKSWMQLEGHPQGVGHFIDYFKYGITQKNQGPYGSSGHVENRPLEFQPLLRWRVAAQHAKFA